MWCAAERLNGGGDSPCGCGCGLCICWCCFPPVSAICPNLFLWCKFRGVNHHRFIIYQELNRFKQEDESIAIVHLALMLALGDVRPAPATLLSNCVCINNRKEAYVAPCVRKHPQRNTGVRVHACAAIFLTVSVSIMCAVRWRHSRSR